MFATNEKNLLPVLDFHEVESTSSGHIWTVFVLKWNLDKDENMLHFELKI